jgi:site-specific DNA-cytosine methylase
MARTEGSIFSGGGILTQAAKQAGYTPVLAVEIHPAYAAIFEQNHPHTRMFRQSIADIPWETLHAYAPLGLLTMGIPCEPFSAIRRLDRGGQAKRDRTLPPEAHALGDMAFWGLHAVDALRPHTVLIENVPRFLEAGTGYVVQAVLRRMGYTVDARVINPLEYGELTGRKRAVIVGTVGPIRWPDPVTSTRTVGEIFDPEPHLWWDRQTKPWPFVHWASQTAKGNGFEPPKIRADDRSVGTIKKRYFAGQGDNPVVAHPDRPGTYRWLTVNEVKRLHGVPETYALGPSKTLAGEVLGQGVVVSLMARIITAVTSQEEYAAGPSTP